MDTICENCRWWKPLPNARSMNISAGDSFTIGECRKKSPKTGVSNAGKPVTSWPTTKSTDWCGDHCLNLAMASGRPSRAASTHHQNES